MGYHAPSAEEVYRYIFRLDHSRAGLCDGFSWSILFVNDNSPVCREFLAHYGAELCYRTADRIRFVFFSGLSAEETQSFAARGPGFLASIIAAAAGWRSPRHRFDWERDQWEMFRPEAFRPLDSPGRVQQQLSMECEINSAMPGSEEALRLAQSLGIGRFVPCFLLFSDVGSPHVYLYPVARQTPDQVFAHLRSWIDSFYEINHLVLTRWAALEQSIETLANNLRVSIGKVETWKRNREQAWRHLQKTSQRLRELEKSKPSNAVLESISEDWGLPWETRDQARIYLDRLRAIDRKLEQASEASSWFSQVKDIADAVRVLEELTKFKSRSTLTPVAASRLNAAIAQFQLPPQPDSPESEVALWWRSEYGRLPSRNRYDRHRTAWSEYSKLKFGSDAVGNVASILKEEFTAISETILSQVVTTTPEDAAQAAVNRIASHLDIPAHDPSWTLCVSEYREALRLYFANLRSHAPNWIIDFGGNASPPLSWGDCIPPLPSDNKTRSSKDRLEQLPRLTQLLQKVQSEWKARVRQLEAAQQREQARCLAELGQEIDGWFSSTAPMNADRQSVWMALIDAFMNTRQILEKQVYDSALSAGHTPYPGDTFSRDEVSHLLQMLDEYGEAINSLRFPFIGDRNVLRVALQMSLSAASGMVTDKSLSSSSRVKDELAEALADAENSRNAWDSIRQGSAEWSPACEFVRSLTEITAVDRLSDLLPSISPTNLLEANNVLADQSAYVSVLDAMTVQELMALERKVCGDRASSGSVPAATKDELYDSILSAIGLRRYAYEQGPSTEAVKKLLEKVRTGAFDVFLAHNSQDKAEVMRLGEELRRQGIYPWIDVEQIPPGRWFQDVIQSAVRTVRTAAIVIGKSGIGRWQMVELRAFLSRCVELGIPLIPVLLPGVAGVPDDLAFLRELNCVQFANDIGEKAAMVRLVWGITSQKPDQLTRGV
jgi:hypothetical protein